MKVVLDETVDDSEPERIELLERGRRLKLQRLEVNPSSELLQDYNKPRSVIILSDDEIKAASSDIIIDISDERSESNSPRRFTRISRAESASRLSKPDSSNLPLKDSAELDVNAYETVTDATIIPCTGLASAASLQHFAFGNPKPSSNRIKATRHIVKTIPEPEPTSKRRPFIAQPRLNGLFLDIDLAGLTKCISCDTRWTTRKSAAQKITHIQSCAKKHAFSDDTVRMLVSKEIQSYVSNKEEKASNVQEALEPKTLYDELAPIIPAKRRKQREAISTVKDVSKTREAILDRARAVLSTGNPNPADEDFSVCTQAMGPANTGSRNPTPFIVKYLTKNSTHVNQVASSLTLNDEDNNEDNFPDTQVFSPSKLGLVGCRYQQLCNNTSPPAISKINTDITKSQVVDDSIIKPISTPSFNIGHSTDGGRNIPLFQAKNNENESAQYSPISFYDSYRTHDSNKFRYSGSISPTVLEQGQNMDEKRYLLSRDIPPGPRAKVDSHAKSKKSPQAENGTERQKSYCLLGQTWETCLMNKITQDSDLYLRILRYEPVPFDIFIDLCLQMEDQPNTSIGQLKEQLRGFLDKKAIHFYGITEKKVRRKNK